MRTPVCATASCDIVPRPACPPTPNLQWCFALIRCDLPITVRGKAPPEGRELEALRCLLTGKSLLHRGVSLAETHPWTKRCSWRRQVVSRRA